MDKSLIMLIAGIVPLLLFVIVDSFSGIKAGVITAGVAALAEAYLSLHWFGEIDWVTGMSVALVILLGVVAYRSESSLHFKMQPVVLSFLFASIMLGTYYMDRPIMLEFANKYADKLPMQMKMFLSSDLGQKYFRYVTLTGGVGLLFHALVTWWAAIRLSNWWWIAIRGIGFYFFLVIAAFSVRFFI